MIPIFKGFSCEVFNRVSWSDRYIILNKPIGENWTEKVDVFEVFM